MTRGGLQYIADTQLLEKLFLIEAGLRKEAGVSEFLSGLAGDVVGWAKSHIDTSSIGSTMKSLADLLLPGVLFKIHPIFGGLAMIAHALGFDPTTIVAKIFRAIKPKLQSGEPLSMDEVNAAGKDAVAQSAGPIESTASTDMFGVLREIERRGQLVRFVRNASVIKESAPSAGFLTELKSLTGVESGGATPTIPFLPDMNASLLERVFGTLFKSRQTGKARWLIGGLIVWIIKTVLLGAGLIAGAELIKGMVTKKPASSVPQENSSVAPAPIGEAYTATPIVLTPNGTNGQDIHANDQNQSTWIVPIVGGSVANTLIAWAGYIYKELEGRGDIIASTGSFNKTVNDMMQHYESSSNQLTVPAKFKSMKQVVDQFASDVAVKL